MKGKEVHPGMEIAYLYYKGYPFEKVTAQEIITEAEAREIQGRNHYYADNKRRTYLRAIDERDRTVAVKLHSCEPWTDYHAEHNRNRAQAATVLDALKALLPKGASAATSYTGQRITVTLPIDAAATLVERLT